MTPFKFRDALERRLNGHAPLADYGVGLDQFLRMKMTPAVRAQIVATVEANVRRERPDVGDVFVLAEMDTIQRNVNVQVWNPIYLHDCDECRFLGRFVDETPPRPEEFDLYVCDKQLTGRTFIARYGDGGPDYTSGRMPGIMPALDEAQRRFYAMDMDP